ncbi:MAG: hypothetical protein V3V49_11695 [Candidatus Krumholzibacteria bacterium]
MLNEIDLAKSLWIEDSRVEPSGAGTAICRGDLDQTPGDEIVFRGTDGFLVLSPGPTAPVVYSAIEARGVRFVDVEGDGDAEYLERSWSEGIRLWDHTGVLLWEVRPDRNQVPAFWTSGVLWADVNDDGKLEFLVGTHQGVELLTGSGDRLSIIGDLPYRKLTLGQLDDDDDLELVTLDYDLRSEAPNREHRLTTWDLDGTKLGSFQAPNRESRRAFEFYSLFSDPEQPGLDRIKLDCALYAPDGTEVGSLLPSDTGYCFGDRADFGREVMFEGCPTDREFEVEPIDVQFRSNAEPFRVEFAYSFELVYWSELWSFLSGPPPSGSGAIYTGRGTYHNTTRVILKIHDGSGALVYHEVLASGSNPGSFTVIPSDVEGEEILLLVDDSSILAYRSAREPK